MNPRILEDIVERHRPGLERGLEIGRAEFRARWGQVQRIMEGKGYDLLYACGSELDRSDVAWLAGVTDPVIERYGILVPRRGTPVLVAGSEGGHVIEEAAKASGAEVALLREFQISDEDYRFARFGRLEDVVKRLAGTRPGRAPRIALASSGQFLPHDHALMFQGRFGADSVVIDAGVLHGLKYEKSPAELRLIAAANAVADAAFLAMLAFLEPGARELDVAAAADYVMKRLGARRTGFPTIVSSGNRGRTVLGSATNKIIRKGEIVSLGLSPTFNGYHGIVRRTVKAGSVRTFAEEQFMACLEGLYRRVMKAVIAAARTGAPSSSIDAAGKTYLQAVRLKDRRGKLRAPREPYTFLHNTGCSECQEGYGAVTPYTSEPLGRNVALMIDVAFMGFDEKGTLVFPIEYAVIEDSLWKVGREVGVFNRIPLDVQDLVGKETIDIPKGKISPFHRALPGTAKRAPGRRR